MMTPHNPSTARALCVAGRSAREAAAGLSAVPEIIQREQRNQYESVVSAVRAELKRAREAWSSEEAAALARLDARLGVSGGVPRASLRQRALERLIGVVKYLHLPPGSTSCLDACPACQLNHPTCSPVITTFPCPVGC